MLPADEQASKARTLVSKKSWRIWLWRLIVRRSELLTARLLSSRHHSLVKSRYITNNLLCHYMHKDSLKWTGRGCVKAPVIIILCHIICTIQSCFGDSLAWWTRIVEPVYRWFGKSFRWKFHLQEKYRQRQSHSPWPRDCHHHHHLPLHVRCTIKFNLFHQAETEIQTLRSWSSKI